jgi:hypothetical protein
MGFAGVLLQAAARFDTPRGRRDNSASAPQQGREVAELDQKIHQMLRELRRALSEAITDSSDVSRTLRRIREEGYSLYLLVDCKREGNDPFQLDAPRFSSSSEPAFMIDGRDLSFLRSIGIDPTRRLRRRRKVAPALPARPSLPVDDDDDLG